MRHVGFGLALVGMLAAGSFARGADLEQLARRAVSPDAAAAERAVEQLRAAGPAGLEALFSVHADLLAQGDAESAAWNRLCAALDAVGGQRDCRASRLYWHTDLERAKAAARAQGKPILSLRLLGKLTDEYSCANSRFFRATLYANREVSRYLRENFVLHWSSERPVPVITIDFGDGRAMKTTLTGNSIHYILDAAGRPVDALPGLYGPQAFRRGLERAAGLVEVLAPLPDEARRMLLVAYHRARIAATTAAWQADLKQLGVKYRSGTRPSSSGSAATLPKLQFKTIANRPRRKEATTRIAKAGGAAAANRAMRLAVPKSLGETPVLRNLFPGDPQWLADNTTPDHWLKIAALHREDAALDAASLALMRDQLPRATDERFALVVEQFQKLIALDTVRNEYLLHRQIHEWFAEKPEPEFLHRPIHEWLAGEEQSEFAALNARVYAELFLTPASDPWLGLRPKGAYTALTNNGLQPRE